MFLLDWIILVIILWKVKVLWGDIVSDNVNVVNSFLLFFLIKLN